MCSSCPGPRGFNAAWLGQLASDGKILQREHPVDVQDNDEGFFYILDGHPFRNVFIDEKGESNSTIIVGDYFSHGPWQYNEMGDYTDPQVLLPSPSYEWTWTMGEIVTAFCDAGLRIEFLHEFPQYFYNGYTPYDVDEEKIEKFPCTFSLKATLK